MITESILKYGDRMLSTCTARLTYMQVLTRRVITNKLMYMGLGI